MSALLSSVDLFLQQTEAPFPAAALPSPRFDSDSDEDERVAKARAAPEPDDDVDAFLSVTREYANGKPPDAEASALSPNSLVYIRGLRGCSLNSSTAAFTSSPWHPHACLRLVKPRSDSASSASLAFRDVVFVQSARTSLYWNGVSFAPSPVPILLIPVASAPSSLSSSALVSFQVDTRLVVLNADNTTSLVSPLAIATGPAHDDAAVFALVRQGYTYSRRDQDVPTLALPLPPASSEEAQLVCHLVASLLGLSPSPLVAPNKELEHVALRLVPCVGDVSFLRGAARDLVRPEQGSACQGLGEHIQSLLDDVDEVCASQFDGGSLSRLIMATQPLLRLAAAWADILKPARGLAGGAMINHLVLHAPRLDAAQADEALERACRGLMLALNAWLFRGELPEGRHDEFFVRRAAFGEGHPGFALLDAAKIPVFFQPHAELILCAGRDLFHCNLARRGALLAGGAAAPLVFAGSSSKAYLEPISHAHRHNARALLDCLLGSHRLLDRLRTLKRFFLLERGDFFVDFIDQAHAELLQPATALSISRLQTQLAICLRVHDPSLDADDVTCEFADVGLHEEVSRIFGADQARTPSRRRVIGLLGAGDDEPEDAGGGADLFCLRYRCDQAMALVATPRALSKYRLLFRHLFKVKHVQTRLHQAWLASKSRVGYLMTHLLQTFAHYVSFEVVEPHWRAFMDKVGRASRVDDIAEAQDVMLDSCLRESLLTFPALIASLNALLGRCSRFCAKLTDERGAALGGFEADVLRGFGKDMKGFLRALSKEAAVHGDAALANLAKRMDWDGFFQ